MWTGRSYDLGEVVTMTDAAMSGSTDGTLSREVAAEVAGLFGVADQWQVRTSRPVPAPRSGSSLARDDEVTAPWQLSHTAVTSLVAAVDHFHAAKSLVTDAHVLHTYALFTLLRGALKNAATAAFVLAPPSRNTRILRSLRVTWADLVERDNLMGLLDTKPAVATDRRKTQLQDIARARGLSVDEVAQVAARSISYSTIVRAAGDEALRGAGEEMLATWMLNSGSAHGKKWASMTMLDRSWVIPSEVPGVRQGLVTAPEGQVSFSVLAARRMIERAWQLHDLRSLGSGS
jgi:hypothetical protein